jgi:hypothetical protein
VTPRPTLRRLWVAINLTYNYQGRFPKHRVFPYYWRVSATRKHRSLVRAARGLFADDSGRSLTDELLEERRRDG